MKLGEPRCRCVHLLLEAGEAGFLPGDCVEQLLSTAFAHGPPFPTTAEVYPTKGNKTSALGQGHSEARHCCSEGSIPESSSGIQSPPRGYISRLRVDRQRADQP